MSLKLDSPINIQYLNSDPLRRFDITSHTWIDFKSESDALFASFWLGDQLEEKPSIPIHFIDVFITLLKHPNFHNDQLSYDAGLDILTGIATSRRKAALARSTTNHSMGDQVSSPVPGIVVDLVAQELGQNALLPTSDWGYVSKPLRCVEESEEQKALKNMCLVHRTWTTPARSMLSQCVDVSGASGLYHLLRSPDLGPLTRMLRYIGDADNTEMRYLLSAVIRNCPGLRDLRMSSILQLNGRQLLEDISNLSKLEALHLGRYAKEYEHGSSSTLLLDVCQALPKMEALKSLTLHSFECQNEGGIPSSMHELSPCSRLTEVNLSGYCKYLGNFEYQTSLGGATIDCIAWIFKQRHDYKISSTFIYTNNIYKLEPGPMGSPTFNKHGLTILPSLATIEFLDISGDRYGAGNRDTDLLSLCISVKHVKLDSEVLRYIHHEDKLDRFPETLESLEVFGSSLTWKKMNSIVQSLPQIRSLHLHTRRRHYDSYASTKLLCQEKGITFTIDVRPRRSICKFSAPLS